MKHSILLLIGLAWLFQVEAQTETSASFEKIQLTADYLSEGIDAGDLNGDGHFDVVAGAQAWLGPDFRKTFLLDSLRKFPLTGPGLSGYSKSFFNRVVDLDGSGLADVVRIGVPGSPAQLLLDPAQKSISGTYDRQWEDMGNESPIFFGHNGVPSLVAFSGGSIRWISLNGTIDASISKKDKKRFPVFIHGLGVGDINGDGRIDVLANAGWWQQPQDWKGESVPWEFHAHRFSKGQGGAQMPVFDVDGDGDADVISALNAHAYGLSWFEQVKDDAGQTSFKEHRILADTPTEGEFNFSQLHAMEAADMDGDGVLDIVTGKCFYAHNGRDPGSHDGAVLYWFKTQRNADGSVSFEPHLIDGDSGVGRQIQLKDINADGRPDVLTSNKKGVFVFLNTLN
ncbi:FG-GAP repeat domain-containing protein [Sediminicola luteus]|uniref:VCBS repeat-containing protein n=1 Tax=Sediminicola luteus TaxID=319238 RepID=A0A2A4G9J3_9FLAO|nr:VCBS repeat-containing protein [Sediminicola luteus]PCE64656.1 hypothetical protein B7P33_05640 [Sediminicola luteus]